MACSFANQLDFQLGVQLDMVDALLNDVQLNVQSNLNSVCYRIWNSILVLGFATALIFEFLKIPKSRTWPAATKLQARSEIYPRSIRQQAQGGPRTPSEKISPC